MPTGNIVADDYIDDPNRTVSEVQTALNQQFDYLRSLKAEVDALSSTVIREAAVRSVGSAAGNVPDKAVLDARLATTGNLGNMATKTASDYLKKSEFDPASATLAWSGSASFVPIENLSQRGPGLYLLKSGIFGGHYLIFLQSESQPATGGCAVYTTTGQINAVYADYESTQKNFRLRSAGFDGTSGATSNQTITEIYKV